MAIMSLGMFLFGNAYSGLLKPSSEHGATKRGRPATTYIDQLRNDTGLSIAELKSIMGNQKEWMELVNEVRVRSK